MNEKNEYRIKRYCENKKINQSTYITRDQNTCDKTNENIDDNEDSNKIKDSKILAQNNSKTKINIKSVDDIKNISDIVSNFQNESSSIGSQINIVIAKSFLEKSDVSDEGFNDTNNISSKDIINQKESRDISIIHEEHSVTNKSQSIRNEQISFDNSGKKNFCSLAKGECESLSEFCIGNNKFETKDDTKRTSNITAIAEDLNETKRKNAAEIVNKITINYDSVDENPSKTKETLIEKCFMEDLKNLRAEVYTIQNNLKYSESYNKKLEEALINQSLEINKMLQNFMNLKEENESLKKKINNFAQINASKNSLISYKSIYKTNDPSDLEHDRRNIELIVSKKCIKFYIEELQIQKKKYEKRLNHQECIIQDLRRIIQEKEAYINHSKTVHIAELENLNTKLTGNPMVSTALSNQINNILTSPSAIHLKMDNGYFNDQLKVYDNILQNKSLPKSNNNYINNQVLQCNQANLKIHDMLNSKESIIMNNDTKFKDSNMINPPIFKESNLSNRTTNTIYHTPNRNYSSEQFNLEASKLCKVFEEKLDKLDKFEEDFGKISISQNIFKNNPFDKLSPADIKYMKHIEDMQEKLNEIKRKSKINANTKREDLNVENIKEQEIMENQILEKKNKGNDGKVMQMPQTLKIQQNDQNKFRLSSSERQNQIIKTFKTQPFDHNQVLNSNCERQKINNSNDYKSIVYNENEDLNPFNDKEIKDKKLSTHKSLVKEDQNSEFISIAPFAEVSIIGKNFDSSFFKIVKKRNEMEINSFSISPIHHENKSRAQEHIENLNEQQANNHPTNSLCYNDQHQTRNEMSITDSSINLNSKIMLDNQDQNSFHPYWEEAKEVVNQDFYKNRYSKKVKHPKNYKSKEIIMISNENIKPYKEVLKKESSKHTNKENHDFIFQFDSKCLKNNQLYPSNFENTAINEPTNIFYYNSINGRNESTLDKELTKNLHENNQKDVISIKRSPKKSNSLINKTNGENVELVVQNNYHEISIRDNSMIHCSIGPFVDGNNTLISINNVLDKSMNPKLDPRFNEGPNPSTINFQNIQELKDNSRKSTPLVLIRPDVTSTTSREIQEGKKENIKEKFNELISGESSKNSKSKHSKHRRIKSSTAISPSISINSGYNTSNQQNKAIENSVKIKSNNLIPSNRMSKSPPIFHQLDNIEINPILINSNGKFYPQTTSHHDKNILPANAKTYNYGMCSINYEENPNNRYDGKMDMSSKVNIAQNPLSHFPKSSKNKQTNYNYQKLKKSDLVMDFHHLENVPILTNRDNEKNLMGFSDSYKDIDRNLNKPSKKMKNKNHEDKHYQNVNNLNINENCSIATTQNQNHLFLFNNKEHNHEINSYESGYTTKIKKEYNNHQINSQSNHFNGIIFSDITNSIEIAHYKEQNKYAPNVYNQNKDQLYSTNNNEHSKKTERRLRIQDIMHDNQYLSKNMRIDEYYKQKVFRDSDKHRNKIERDRYDKFDKDSENQLKDEKNMMKLMNQKTENTNITAIKHDRFYE